MAGIAPQAPAYNGKPVGDESESTFERGLTAKSVHCGNIRSSDLNWSILMPDASLRSTR